MIEPYFGGSHRAWARGYIRHSRHAFELLTLPARFWKWRMQGGAVTLLERARALSSRPALLLVSDMLNLPAFLGLGRDLVSPGSVGGDVPVALYCHENQLTYPLQPGEARDLTYAMINWLSMLAADRIFFNSHHHMESWFDELPRMLKHFPGFTHVHRIPEVRAKASVLYVGCDLASLDSASGLDSASHVVGRGLPTDAPSGEVGRVGDVGRGRAGAASTDAPSGPPPLILWNQRWEYDKAPEVFFRALDALAAQGVAFWVALAGSNVRQQPEEFAAARERLGARVVHYGRADAETYRRLLWQSDIVVSTAIHEFFGIAVVEAVYCGCFPVLPRRLAYVETMPLRHHETCLYEDFEGLVTRLRWALTHITEARRIAADLREAVARFDWSIMAPQYDTALESLKL